MEQYTIFCTPEQTRKALELGAPIYMTFAPGDYIEPILAVKDENSKEKTYLCPTAEQMIGWLETKVELGLHVWRGKDYYGFSLWDGEEEIKYRNDFATREEAVLAAIDEALEYLINNKK